MPHLDAAAPAGALASMRKPFVAAAFLACASLLAAGCSGDPEGRDARRVIVLNLRDGAPVDIGRVARRLSTEARARVFVRDVDVSTEAALRQSARRIVAERPALVVSPSARMVYGLRNYTETIPVLFVTIADPVESSLVPDERRPRGNVSGFSFHVPVEDKQLELLKRAFPGVRRVGVMGDRTLFTSATFRQLSQAARGPLALELERVHFETVADLKRALGEPAAQAIDAWVVPEGGAAYRFAREVVALIDATGKPAVYGSDRFVKLGGLMSYSPSFEDPSERVVQMALTVLQGFPVGDLPVEHPHAFRFAVNTVAWKRFDPPPARRVLLMATDYFAADAHR